MIVTPKINPFPPPENDPCNSKNTVTVKEEPQDILEKLDEIGIDLPYVSQRLEDEGIQKFIDPYESAIEAIEKQAQSA